ncbi:MAG TPA: hypothetical protein VM101_12955 [Flavitalea sp.]|nr:hypothetical protein [Flavitalea sp.]
MITRLFIFFSFMIFSSTCLSQSDSVFHFVKDYRGGITDFTVDNLGNFYFVYQNGQLKKLRPDGDSLAVFNNVRKFGKLYSLDVSNPLKVLLYFKGFNTVVILDRLLNERSIVDLRKHNLMQVRAIGQSYDNNLWVFDELEVKLKKIGDDGRLIDQSNDFRQMFDSTPSPSVIVDQDKLVYMYDQEKGVYTFDYYGGFKSRIPLTGWRDFTVINNSLFGRDGLNLYRYDAVTMELQRFALPSFMNDAQKIVIRPGAVYLLRDGVIMVYSYGVKTF